MISNSDNIILALVLITQYNQFMQIDYLLGEKLKLQRDKNLL